MTTITQERAALGKVGRRLRTREQAGFRFGSYGVARSVDEPATRVFVHITITNPAAYSSDDAHARAVEAIGISRFPSTGVSYNRLHMRSGTAYEGQPIGRRGAHTINDKHLSACVTSGCPSKGGPLTAPSWNLNVNARAYAICQNVGDSVTDAELDSLARSIAADMLAGFVSRSARIHGHRCVSSKDCPASKMWARMPELQRLVAHYVSTGFTAPNPPSEDDMAGEGPEILSKLNSFIQVELGRYQRFEQVTQAITALAKANAAAMSALSSQIKAEDVADDAEFQARVTELNTHISKLEAAIAAGQEPPAPKA